MAMPEILQYLVSEVEKVDPNEPVEISRPVEPGETVLMTVPEDLRRWWIFSCDLYHDLDEDVSGELLSVRGGRTLVTVMAKLAVEIFWAEIVRMLSVQANSLPKLDLRDDWIVVVPGGVFCNQSGIIFVTS